MNVFKINTTVSEHQGMFHEYPEFGFEDKEKATEHQAKCTEMGCESA